MIVLYLLCFGFCMCMRLLCSVFFVDGLMFVCVCVCVALFRRIFKFLSAPFVVILRMLIYRGGKVCCALHWHEHSTFIDRFIDLAINIASYKNG